MGDRSSFTSSNKKIIVHKSVVQINDVCSGFIIPNNLVLTASHCIRGINEQVVEFYDHSRAKFKILHDTNQMGNDKDYAILEGDTKDLPPLELTTRWPKHKELVYHIGYSRGQKAQFLAPGIYDRHECTSKGCEHYIVCYIVPGDSGGPLISQRDGKVFGIVHSSYWPANIPYGIGTPIQQIIEKIKELKPEKKKEEKSKKAKNLEI